MLPEAPTLFSTTTGRPSRCESLGPTVRAIRSMPVPGVKGTMSLMGAWLDVSTLAGVFCAGALDANKNPASRANVMRCVK